MAANQYSDGKTIDWTNGSGGAVSSGDAIGVGSRVGVAHDDIANGAVGVLHMEGVWSMPKAGVTLSQGEDVYLTAATGGNITNVATSNIPAGQMWADAASGDATGLVKLGPTSAPAA